MKDFLSIRRLTKKYEELNDPVVRKLRIVPDWETDATLQKAEPKQSMTESFIVRRKEEIQRNRWKTLVKSISTIEEQTNNNLNEFKRRASVKIVRNNESRFLKFVGLDTSSSLPQIQEIFRKGQMFDRLAQRTQPYWKKFLPPKRRMEDIHRLINPEQ